MLNDVGHLDCYVQHLTHICEEHPIHIEVDICNGQGAVIVPKGRHFDLELAERLSEHTLQEPLENCIQLDELVNAQELMQLFKAGIETDQNIALFHERWQLNSLLAKSCEFYGQFPLLMQKMTVLKYEMPHLFKQALFCAYTSLAIARRLKANRDECVCVFLAGFIHDIGILHLDLELVTKKDEYTPEQWQAMQSHTQLGAKILKRIPNMPPSVIKAILEHHERYDGSGYPCAKKGMELGTMGQIIGMADTCLALYKRDLHSKKLGFDALLPILQLNPGIYCDKVFKAIVGLIKDIPWPIKRLYPDESMPKVVSRLLLTNEGITHDYSVLYGLVVSINPHLPKNKKSAMLRNMTQRIHFCLQRSGILQREHKEWMRAQKKEDYVAIERLEIMYAEIRWQMKQLRKLLTILWEKHQLKHPQLNQEIRKGLWQIEQYHRNHTGAKVH
jgi:HD-GYP domain-containing protein (c-di-GMP phosphodiesterase class II)